MRVRSIVLADAVIAQPDGKTVIIGAGIDRIQASRFPWSHAQMAVFVSLQGEGEQDGSGTEHDLRIRILAPNSEVIAEVGGPFTVTWAYPDADPAHSAQNAGIGLQQVQFPEAGIYTVEALIDEREPESLEFNVVQGPPPETQWTHLSSGSAPTA